MSQPKGPKKTELVGTLPNGTQVFASSISDGRDRIAVVDAYVEHQSVFDRHARLGLTNGINVTLDMYLSYVSSQVMEWSDVELDWLKRIFQDDVAHRLERFHFDLPPQIHLVQTTGQEEGHAAYTREMSTVVLPANMVSSLFAPASFGDPLHPGGSPNYLADVIVHEFFHLFSKNNPHRRAELYRLVNFEETPEPILLPDVQWPAGTGVMMPDLKITNPDTPVFNSYIELDVPESSETDAPKVKKSLVPILLATSIYKGGSFFPYLDWSFMAIHKVDGSWTPTMNDGVPEVYPSGPLKQQYLDRVGRNITGELFHPDELLAQNWVLVSKQPDPKLLEEIGSTLQTPKAGA